MAAADDSGNAKFYLFGVVSRAIGTWGTRMLLITDLLCSTVA